MSINTQDQVIIYRFMDAISISFSDSSSNVYISPAMAHTLGEFLKEMALDVHNVDYLKSTLTTKYTNKKGKIS